jgi:glutaconate CoA-transferase, subunit A
VVYFVAEAPAGTRPSDAHGITDRDNDFYRGRDAISRDRAAFLAWMDKHVISRAVAA